MSLVLSSLISWASGKVYVECLIQLEVDLEISWLCTRTMFFADSYPIMIFILYSRRLSVSNGTTLSILSQCIVVGSFYILFKIA
ncbi:hypothetical protein BDY19DRAFT_975865, partial [Irpex rosettiformis]